MRKALIVGINNYKGRRLAGCENDANAVKEVLRRHANNTCNFTIIKPKKDVETRAGLLEEIENLFNANTETEASLFYFSGHGGYNADHGGGFISTSDFKNTEDGIFMGQILNMANASKCPNRIIILDCCHAGAMGNITSSITGLKEGVSILSASKSNEYALDGLEHGVFTSLLLEALKGGAADLTGHVTVGGVYAYIDKALGPCGQRPVFKTNTAKFLPLRASKPPIDIEILHNLIEYFLDPTYEYKLNPSFEFTNVKGGVHRNQEPYALDKHVEIFKDLQALNRVGLVSPNCDDLPIEERHMYFAAMESKSCKLTLLGKFYWQLVYDGII